MDGGVLLKLLEDVQENWDKSTPTLAAIGAPADLFELRARLEQRLGYPGVVEMYAPIQSTSDALRPFSDLKDTQSRLLIVTGDADKEELIAAALPWLPTGIRLIFAGYQHYQFRDPQYLRLMDGLIAPSIANGYPECTIHLYQILENAARLGLKGSVAEFGVFKGGTTQLLGDAIVALGVDWKVYAFDTFNGFPAPKRSLDAYDHVGAEYGNFERISALLQGLPVELIRGDICQTASRISGEPMILTFVDTDNYSAAHAAITAVMNDTVVGGAIVLDHFTGVERFRYTLGERMAAKELLVPDPRFFNLHGTGVFIRQGV